MPNNTLTTAGMFVAKDGPDYTEMTRAGGHWMAMSASGTSLVAIPAASAILELWNNVNSGMMMSVTDLFLYNSADATAVLHNPSVWAMVTAPKAVPTISAIVIKSLSGRAPYTSSVGTRVVSAVPASGLVANGWRPWGTPGSGVIAPGQAWSVPVDGKYLVPPGSSLCITVVDTLAEASFNVGASWIEVPIVSTVGTLTTPA